MTGLTTHVLDTMNGCPASGMALSFYRMSDAGPVLIKSLQLNDDGRADAPLLAGAEFKAGRYSLSFEVAAYFRSCSAALPSPPFLDVVPLDFGIADTDSHYHVPLLVSPWSYSTYRGS